MDSLEAYYNLKWQVVMSTCKIVEVMGLNNALFDWKYNNVLKALVWYTCKEKKFPNQRSLGTSIYLFGTYFLVLYDAMDNFK